MPGRRGLRLNQYVPHLFMRKRLPPFFWQLLAQLQHKSGRVFVAVCSDGQALFLFIPKDNARIRISQQLHVIVHPLLDYVVCAIPQVHSNPLAA